MTGIHTHAEGLLTTRGVSCGMCMTTVNLREEFRPCKYLTFCNGGCIAHNGAMCADFVKFMDYLYGEGLRKYKSYLLTKREDILRRLNYAV